MAGSLSYEALDGTRCQVTTDRPASLDINLTTDHEDHTGYFAGSDSGFGASVGLSIPLSNPTRTARTQCEELGRLDQLRNHFIWLQEQYDAGLIKREALAEAAAALGMELTSERPADTSDGFVVTLP